MLNYVLKLNFYMVVDSSWSLIIYWNVEGNLVVLFRGSSEQLLSQEELFGNWEWIIVFEDWLYETNATHNNMHHNLK